jgi:hypothetical protein
VVQTRGGGGFGRHRGYRIWRVAGSKKAYAMEVGGQEGGVGNKRQRH